MSALSDDASCSTRRRSWWYRVDARERVRLVVIGLVVSLDVVGLVVRLDVVISGRFECYWLGGCWLGGRRLGDQLRCCRLGIGSN